MIVILKETFKHAVQWGLLDANPAQYVERPRGEDKEMDVLTPKEVRQLLDAQPEPLRTLLRTAVLTALAPRAPVTRRVDDRVASCCTRSVLSRESP